MAPSSATMDHMHGRLLTGFTVGVAALLALTGCQGGDTATTPPPSISGFLPTTSGTATFPTPATTAVPSTTPTTPTASVSLITVRPTTSADIETLAKEAEQVYVEYMTLRLKYEANGGVNGPLPADLKKYVDGQEAITAEAVLRQAYSLRNKLTGIESLRIVRRSAFAEGLAPNALIGVEFCDDNSGITVTPPNEEPGPAATVLNRAQFGRGTDGQLRMIDNRIREVDSCDA